MRKSEWCGVIVRPLPVISMLILSGCGSPPEVHLDFPLSNAQFSGDSLSLRGRFTSNDPENAEIIVKSKGGALAASLDRANLSWSLSDFELLEGPQTVQVNAESRGSRRGANVDLELDTSLNTLRVTGIADVAGQIFVSDARLRSVVRVDRLTGVRTLVSGPSRGDGPIFDAPVYLQADDVNLLVLDSGSGSILEVDTFTGNRKLISGLGQGSGEPFERPTVFRVSGGEILVADPGLDAIVSVDRTTGDREIIFREFFEGMPVILSPRGIVVDSAGVIYVADAEYRGVIAIDRWSGQYDVASGGEVGDGPPIVIPRDLEMTTDQQLLLLDIGAKAVLEVDLLTGDRWQRGGDFEIPVSLEVTNEDWLVADNGQGVVWTLSESDPNSVVLTRVGVGEGAELSFPVDVISLSSGWLTVNRTSGELIRIDAESSNRNIVGDGFGLPVSLAQDQTSQEIYVLDAQLNFSGVLVCDPQTGSVRELASPSVGSGPLLIAPRQLLLESGRLLILETLTASLLSLDISSGEREVFASEQLGAGESIAGATRFTLDGSRNALYLLDSFRGRVLQLDLESGLRSEIVSANSESNWSDIKYDNENDRLLILDRLGARIYSFDLIGRTLSILSGDGVGRGDLPADAYAFSYMPNNLIAVVDASLDALFIYDLESGDRVMVSR